MEVIMYYARLGFVALSSQTEEEVQEAAAESKALIYFFVNLEMV